MIKRKLIKILCKPVELKGMVEHAKMDVDKYELANPDDKTCKGCGAHYYEFKLKENNGKKTDKG